MRSTSVVSAAALCLVSACADSVPVQPTTAALSAYSATAFQTDGEVGVIDSTFADAADYGVSRRSDAAFATAELLYDAQAASEAPPTIVFANDRIKLAPARWVRGDPRRFGREDLTWGYVGFNPTGVTMFDPATGGTRMATAAELEARVVEAVDGWQNRACVNEPAARLGLDSPLPPDIIVVGWVPSMILPVFENLGILGVTFTFVWVNPDGTPTDIDADGQADVAWREIWLNAQRVWSDNGPLGTIDLFSVVAHEAGHGFGMGHFGKVFVRTKDIPKLELGDVSVIKYAPKALMNAVYVTGRSEIAGTDNASMCQIAAGQM